MRYLFLVYSREDRAETMTAEDHARIRAGHVELMAETSRRGILQAALPLQPTTTATTVRMQNGATLVTDGPFAETKEQLAGFYLLDCEDLDEAIAFAARIPSGCAGADGCIEIRPIREMNVDIRGQQIPAQMSATKVSL